MVDFRIPPKEQLKSQLSEILEDVIAWAKKNEDSETEMNALEILKRIENDEFDFYDPNLIKTIESYIHEILEELVMDGLITELDIENLDEEAWREMFEYAYPILINYYIYQLLDLYTEEIAVSQDVDYDMIKDKFIEIIKSRQG